MGFSKGDKFTFGKDGKIYIIKSIGKNIVKYKRYVKKYTYPIWKRSDIWSLNQTERLGKEKFYKLAKSI